MHKKELRMYLREVYSKGGFQAMEAANGYENVRATMIWNLLVDYSKRHR